MRKKPTPGERIARNYAVGLHPLEQKGLAGYIDRAIRRAWNEGMKFMLHNPQFHDERANAATWNPYRKAKR